MVIVPDSGVNAVADATGLAALTSPPATDSMMERKVPAGSLAERLELRVAPFGTVLDLRITTSQNCEVVLSSTRI